MLHVVIPQPVAGKSQFDQEGLAPAGHLTGKAPQAGQRRPNIRPPGLGQARLPRTGGFGI